MSTTINDLSQIAYINKQSIASQWAQKAINNQPLIKMSDMSSASHYIDLSNFTSDNGRFQWSIPIASFIKPFKLTEVLEVKKHSNSQKIFVISKNEKYDEFKKAQEIQNLISDADTSYIEDNDKYYVKDKPHYSFKDLKIQDPYYIEPSKNPSNSFTINLINPTQTFTAYESKMPVQANIKG